MLLVTTMNYDELASLIKNKSVILNNDGLIFGQDTEAVHSYLTERLGGTGYVVGIRGRINTASAKLLARLDRGLAGNKVIIEATASEDEALAFTVKSIEEAIEIMTYGLPKEVLYDHLDNTQVSPGSTGEVEIVCIPDIKKDGGVRITSLSRDINIDAEGITIVKLRGGS